MKIRIGNGIDFHRIKEGENITLAGMQVESKYEIIAHSDGDIILHALVDAILGALALPDIGTYFPDTDPQWKNARSVIFLHKALELMKERNFAINNVDITIVGEVPKIKPIRSLLVENLAKLLNVTLDCVSIKATTVDKMGAIGRKEGIGCFATVCLIG
jgi:2-C-methyl-D-erythritol 2,4-cyclodiphosphate synthase